MKSFRRIDSVMLFGLAAAISFLATPAAAQISTSGPTLTGLSQFEQSITMSDILPAVTLNVPANVLASITGGALDLRAQTNYNPQANALTSTFFTVQNGSPTPTNLSQISPANVYGSIVISVSQLYVTSRAAMFVGAISSASSTLFGSYQATPASFSFTYSSATPPVLTNAIFSIAGTLAFVSPTATGNVTITQPPATGGGSTSTGVTIVVSAGGGITTMAANAFQVSQNQLMLNASQSTSSNPGALTYSWVSAPGSENAGIIGANTATPLIQLFAIGTYQFTLTVTDAKGVTATATVTVQYI